MSRAKPTDRLARSPVHLLHRAQQRAEALFEAGMAGSDLTHRQYAVLSIVSEIEGPSQADLVERTGIDRSTLADIVRRLMKKGLLQRRRAADDARAYAIRLTDDGQRALRSAEPVASQTDAELLAALPSSRTQRFLDDLSAIVGRFAEGDAANRKPRR